MRKAICLLVALLAMFTFIGTSQAELTGLNGYQVTQIYASEIYTGKFIGGLDLYNNHLYFGEYTEIKSLDLADPSTTTTLCTVSPNPGNSIATVDPSTGTLYTAYGLSGANFPYDMGYVDSGAFNWQATIDGAYDSAIDSTGSLYITANPGGLGTQVLSYAWNNGATETIINIGGASGGLAFDADNNLYVSDYDNNQILYYAATTLSGAQSTLTANDADGTIALTMPGYLAVDSENGYLYASHLDAYWCTYVDRINLADTNDRLAVTTGGGKMVLDDEGALYMIDSDWSVYNSTVNRVAAVPEPSTLILILAGLVSLAMLRRK